MPFQKISRRTCLRAGGIAIGLPTLEAMLSVNGDRFADGAVLPANYVVCFGGISLGTIPIVDTDVPPTQAIPDGAGFGYRVDNKIGLAPFAETYGAGKPPIRDQISIVSNLNLPYGPKGETDPAKIP